MDDRYKEVTEEPKEDSVITDKQSEQAQPDTSVPVYDYGRNQEPLDGALAVRGGSAGGSYYATATSVAATGNLTVTGCPFTPTYARVTAMRGYSGCVSTSVGAATASPGSMVGNSDGSNESSNSYFVIVRDNGGTVVSRATFTNFTSDGCVFNFSVQSGTTSLLVELFG